MLPVAEIKKGSSTVIEEVGNDGIFSGAQRLCHFLEKLK